MDGAYSHRLVRMRKFTLRRIVLGISKAKHLPARDVAHLRRHSMNVLGRTTVPV
jgi:hypothetical protein